MSDVGSIPADTGDMVSIVVPVYNSERDLRRCMDSILRQTYGNLEVLLVDDGSTDGSGAICDAYARTDGRVSVLHTDNQGPASARNAGMEKSRGSFIFFTDSDDELTHNAIQVMVEGYRETKADMVAADFAIQSPSRPADEAFLFSQNLLMGTQDTVENVRGYCRKPRAYSIFNYTWGKLFRSSIIRNNNLRFDTTLRVFEDLAFNFEYLKYATTVYYVRQRIYTYFCDNPASADTKMWQRPLGFEVAIRSIGGYLERSGLEASVIEREIGQACVSFAIRIMVRCCARAGHWRQSYRVVRELIQDPEIRRNLNHYTPMPGDSRILPILMRLNLAWPVIIVCKYKTHRRNRGTRR